jgi:hypothetical protein
MTKNDDFEANLIFISNKDLDKSIYRVFSYDRLKEIFDYKKLSLIKPKKWDDPFENFILNSLGNYEDGSGIQNVFRNNYYGQCWSFSKENDAMWRIYSPNKDGIKVKTTIRKLYTQLLESSTLTQKTYYPSLFIGKVKYQSTKQLTNMLVDKERMSNKLFDKSGWGQASTFYYKRWAFRHEHEVRIMFNNFDDCANDLFSFNIEPLELFDEIVFDPRMKKDEYLSKKEELLSLNFKKSISQSSLYSINLFKTH